MPEEIQAYLDNISLSSTVWTYQEGQFSLSFSLIRKMTEYSFPAPKIIPCDTSLCCFSAVTFAACWWLCTWTWRDMWKSASFDCSWYFSAIAEKWLWGSQRLPIWWALMEAWLSNLNREVSAGPYIMPLFPDYEKHCSNYRCFKKQQWRPDDPKPSR